MYRKIIAINEHFPSEPPRFSDVLSQRDMWGPPDYSALTYWDYLFLIKEWRDAGRENEINTNLEGLPRWRPRKRDAIIRRGEDIAP